MPAQRSDSLPSQTVKVSCKRRSTARLKSAVADEMCKQYDLKRAVRPLSICDDVEALECSQRRRHLNGCRAQFGIEAAVPSLSAQTQVKSPSKSRIRLS